MKFGVDVVLSKQYLRFFIVHGLLILVSTLYSSFHRETDRLTDMVTCIGSASSGRKRARLEVLKYGCTTDPFSAKKTARFTSVRR